MRACFTFCLPATVIILPVTSNMVPFSAVVVDGGRRQHLALLPLLFGDIILPSMKTPAHSSRLDAAIP